MPHSIAGQAIDVGRVSSTLGAFSIESMVIGVGIYSHLHMSDGYAKSAGQPRHDLAWIFVSDHLDIHLLLFSGDSDRSVQLLHPTESVRITWVIFLFFLENWGW